MGAQCVNNGGDNMVVFVIGPACAGKSTFIKERFKDYKVVDLYDFQRKTFMTTEDIYKSYENCRDALIEALKENEDVVLEHTLLLAKRRGMYIDAVRSVTDAPIDVYCILPTSQALRERRIERGASPLISVTAAKSELTMFEVPKKEDGFRNIIIINN